jgi:hypothetical protein
MIKSTKRRVLHQIQRKTWDKIFEETKFPISEEIYSKVNLLVWEEIDREVLSLIREDLFKKLS